MNDDAIHGIAEDAAHLLDALKGQEFNFDDCMKLLIAAMPALVTANTWPAKP